MNTEINPDSLSDRAGVVSGVARSIGSLALAAVRLPVLAFLTILEPIVRLVLCGAATLGVLTAFLFEFSGVVTDFPFWLMMSFSIGCMLLLMAYHALMRLLS